MRKWPQNFQRMLFVSLSRKSTPTPATELQANYFDRFGPQKVNNAVERFTRWREETLPADSLAFPDVTPSACFQSTENTLTSDAVSATGRAISPDTSSETMSSSGSLIAPTSRPSNKQTLAHVLIVDDNDINLKVSIPFTLWIVAFDASFPTAFSDQQLRRHR